MLMFLSFLTLQSYWFFIIKYASHNIPDSLVFLLTIVITCALYFLFKLKISFIKLLGLITLSTLWGLAQDTLLIHLGLMHFKSAPLWLLSLWVIFVHYFEYLLRHYQKVSLFVLSLIGGIGGAASYYAGYTLYGYSSSNPILFIFITFVSWAIFFPLMMKLYFTENIFHKILDYSVIFNFDRTGYQRHAKSFSSLTSAQGKVIFITGATSGIGKSLLDTFKSLDAQVHFCGRRLNKGNKIAHETKTQFHPLDMMNWSDVSSIVDKLPCLDVVVLNAGAMPEVMQTNEQGIESQCASQLYGHYILIDTLRKKNKLSRGAKIIWVSSGGMYLKKLDLSQLNLPLRYDKVDVYANVKRAQVTLVEELAKDESWHSYCVVSMHPGWVKTPGLSGALPAFTSFLDSRLRTQQEGADTIAWLATTSESLLSGSFYFDRQKVSPYISKSYQPSKRQRQELVELIDSTIRM